MPNGKRAFVKIGVDDVTKKWIHRELNTYTLLEAHAYPYMPKLLAYDDGRTALVLEALENSAGWDWTDTWSAQRLDKTLEAVDILAEY